MWDKKQHETFTQKAYSIKKKSLSKGNLNIWFLLPIACTPNTQHMCTAYVSTSQVQGNFLVRIFFFFFFWRKVARLHYWCMRINWSCESCNWRSPSQLVPCLIKMNSSNQGWVSWTFWATKQRERSFNQGTIEEEEGIFCVFLMLDSEDTVEPVHT